VVSILVQVVVLYVTPLLTKTPIKQLPPTDTVLSLNQWVEFDGVWRNLHLVMGWLIRIQPSTTGLQ
jgi:hypothetical protein